MRERNFAYAVGRIRALETKLFDRTRLERLSEANSLQEALSGLSETEYGPAIANLKNPTQFELALNNELARVVKLLLDLADDAPELRVFIYRYDLQNLKVILKTINSEPTGLSRLGYWSPEWLLQKVHENDLTELPALFRDAYEQAKEAFKATGDTQEIDRIIDAVGFDYGYHTLKNGISDLLLNWWIALIDLTNIRTFIRLRFIGLGFAEFSRFFITNGILDLGDFKELWDQPNEKVTAWLGNTVYSKLLTDGPATLNSLTQLERESDNFLINLIEPAKMISLGIEPLVGYLLAKENEVKLLRIILVGKANQLSNPEIKERLRRAYA
ncbi:MAG: V-type ATPase subunit [Bacteroidota bacterium]